MSDAIIISLIAAGAAIISGGIGGYVTYRVAKLEKKVDGRLTQILELTRKESAATGNKDGRDEMKQEQKERRQEDEDREDRKGDKSTGVEKAAAAVENMASAVVTAVTASKEDKTKN